MNARIETTGKQDVRRDVQGRILEVTTRLAAMRGIVERRLGATHDVSRTIDQAELQLMAQRRIAERSRSTLPALRAAADEAERVCQVAAGEVKAAVDAAKLVAKPRKVVAEVVYGAGERVQVLMVTYPVYRYDVAVDGQVVWSIPATRAWKTERKQAIAEAVAAV